MKLDSLFIGAHPDDVELSCGGTVVKMVKAGNSVGILNLTRGELSTRGSVKIREREASEAAKILGVKVRENLELEDGSIENNPGNRLKLISAIRKYTPELIFAPYPRDRHPDHKHASQLVSEASFYSGLTKIITKIGSKKQKPYRPNRILYYMQTYTFEPSFITDISNEFETKMKAIRCYASQFYNPESKEPDTFISDKKFIEYLEARARFYGFQIGARYGEPFFSEEALKLDPSDIT